MRYVPGFSAKASDLRFCGSFRRRIHSYKQKGWRWGATDNSAEQFRLEYRCNREREPVLESLKLNKDGETQLYQVEIA